MATPPLSELPTSFDAQFRDLRRGSHGSQLKVSWELECAHSLGEGSLRPQARSQEERWDVNRGTWECLEGALGHILEGAFSASKQKEHG